MITSILLVVLQYIFVQTKLFGFVELIIISTWVFVYYENIQTSLFYIFSVSLVFELITFGSLGVHALSYSLSLLILYFLQNFLNVITEEKRLRMVITGGIINFIFMSIFTYILDPGLNTFMLILGYGISILFLFIFIRFIKLKRESIYET